MSENKENTRIIDVVTTSLLAERLMYEQKLQETIHEDIDIEDKLIKIKMVMKEIILTEQMSSRWSSYTKVGEESALVETPDNTEDKN